MPGIQIKGLKEAIAKLDRFKQGAVKNAAAYAINQTVAGAAESMAREIRDVFDKPTPYIQRAVWKTWAKPGDLSAKVFIANKERPKKALRQDEILRPHIFGGGRGVKNSERRLRRIGFMGQNQWIVPGPGAPKDQFGNVSSGTMVKILSQIQAFSEAGFNANAKIRGMTWKRYKQLGSLYVVPMVGVFSRQSGGQSIPVLYFTDSAPQYEAKRFDFNFVAENYAKKNFPANFREAIKRS